MSQNNNCADQGFLLVLKSLTFIARYLVMVEPIFDYQFRLILIGDSTVGKSSLLKYFTDGKFFEVGSRCVFGFSSDILMKLNTWALTDYQVSWHRMWPLYVCLPGICLDKDSQAGRSVSRCMSNFPSSRWSHPATKVKMHTGYSPYWWQV